MCSWTSPSTGKFKSQRSELLNDATEEDDESEDQVVYGYDLPSELLGLYQQRHQLKAQRSSHGIITNEKTGRQETSAKCLVPPCAVEEAAWASLTAACSTLDRPTAAGIQAGSHAVGPQKISWAEALENLIQQEVHSDERKAPTELQVVESGDARAEDGWAQTTVESVAHEDPTSAQSAKFHPQRKFDTFGFSKGKQKHYPTERFRINNTKAPQPHLKEGAPIPLAQRLQDLVDKDSRHNPEPRHASGMSHSPSLTIAEKLHSLIERSASAEGYHKHITVTKVNRQSPSLQGKEVSTAQINRSPVQDDIVDCPDLDEDDSGVQGSSRFIESPGQSSRSTVNVQKRQQIFNDEHLEDIDNDDDCIHQETTTSKSILGASSNAPSRISDRFRHALLSAPPDVSSTESFGLSVRLETLLSVHKTKHIHFTKGLQRKLQDLGHCLEVVILGTIDEAQLRTCRCDVLRAPEEWSHERRLPNVPVDNAQNASVIDVIFSKISSGVELQVGRVVRIHPPWQEPSLRRRLEWLERTLPNEGVAVRSFW